MTTVITDELRADVVKMVELLQAEQRVRGTYRLYFGRWVVDVDEDGNVGKPRVFTEAEKL